MADGFVSVSRRINASAERLFALLADSANHPLIDGSGMVREPAPAVRLSRAGDSFVMDMHRDGDGYYQMRNAVVEYEAGRRLAWEPARVAASPEEQEAIGGPARYRWGYELPLTAPAPPWSPRRSTAPVPRRACAMPSGRARSGGTPWPRR